MGSEHNHTNRPTNDRFSLVFKLLCSRLCIRQCAHATNENEKENPTLSKLDSSFRIEDCDFTFDDQGVAHLNLVTIRQLSSISSKHKKRASETPHQILKPSDQDAGFDVGIAGCTNATRSRLCSASKLSRT